MNALPKRKHSDTSPFINNNISHANKSQAQIMLDDNTSAFRFINGAFYISAHLEHNFQSQPRSKMPFTPNDPFFAGGQGCK